MHHILLVEDSATQAMEIRMTLEDAGYTVTHAENGRRAVAAIEQQTPHLILTDLHMPEMSGLELVEHVRQKHSAIPVILITADGNELIAVEALRKGASSYIPKSIMATELLPTIRDIIKVLDARHTRDEVVNALVESESTFAFGNDPEFVSGLAAHLEEDLQKMKYDDLTGVFRIVLALKEAVINAIDHGNLELDSALRDRADGSYQRLAESRREQEPYRSRRITLRSKISQSQVVYTIRDEGPGFDPSVIPDPRDPDNITRAHGRGLMLIQTFMDQVNHNPRGNEITMIKFRQPSAAFARQQ